VRGIASKLRHLGTRAIDRAVPKELTLQPEDRMRARVLVGAAATFLLIGALSAIAGLADGKPVVTVVLGFTALWQIAALVVLRRFRSVEAGTILVCCGNVFCSAFFAAQEGGLYVTTTAWIACVPLLAAFLAGGRAGLISAVIVVFAMFGVWRLHAAGMAFTLWDMPPVHHAPSWITNILAHFVVALFAWRYSNERAAVLEGLAAHRDRLASVLESADAAIVSADRDLIITACNAGGRAMGALAGTKVEDGLPLLDAFPEEIRAEWIGYFERALQGEALSFEYYSPVILRDLELTIRPVGEGAAAGITIFARDVTDSKKAMNKLAAARREMIELSRVAGMADVATGVLHNVGNALNSAKTSAHVVEQRLDDLAKPRLAKLVALLPEDPADLAKFIVEDPRGGRIVRFLQEVATQSSRATVEAIGELERLGERLDHIRHIVAEQQAIAKGKRVLVEECDPKDLVRTAVDLASGKGNATVSVEQEIDVPKLVVDRHKVIQILGNLVANARESARDAGVAEPRVDIRTARTEHGIRIEIEDNGIGMEPTTLARVFEHGFTTKDYGHGFGLHTAANQIKDLGGSVTACSSGLGTGATFVLELPLRPPQAA
jgi:two-component system sensor kinase FixL